MSKKCIVDRRKGRTPVEGHFPIDPIVNIDGWLFIIISVLFQVCEWEESQLVCLWLLQGRRTTNGYLCWGGAYNRGHGCTTKSTRGRGIFWSAIPRIERLKLGATIYLGRDICHGLKMINAADPDPPRVSAINVSLTH